MSPTTVGKLRDLFAGSILLELMLLLRHLQVEVVVVDGCVVARLLALRRQSRPAAVFEFRL